MTCPPNALRTGKDVIDLQPGTEWTARWGIAPGDGAAMSAPLDGQVVAVTGSSSGIGAATARAFAAAGAAVLVNSSRSVAEGEAVAASLPDALYVQGDITDPAFADRLVAAALERWGRLDTLVNNAGTTAVIPHHDVAAATVDVWRRIFEVNVFGTWAMTVAALPALREAHGSVVNVASVAGVRPDRLLHPLRGEQGGPQPHDGAAGQGGRARGAGQRRGARARRHALDRRTGTSCARWCARWRRSSARGSPRTWPR